MNVRRLSVAGAALALLGVCVWARGSVAGGVFARAERAAEVSGVACSGLPCFSLGETRDYQLKLTSNVQVASGAPPLELVLQGRLAVTALDAGSKSTTDDALYVKLFDAKIHSAGAEPATLAAMAHDLEEGFMVERSHATVRAVRMAASASRFAVGVARTLAAELGMGTSDPNARSWSVQESDATGLHRTAYERLPQPSVFSKKKLSYDPLELKSTQLGGVKLRVVPEIMASEGRIELAAGRLRSVTYGEKLRTRLLSSGQAEAETSLALTALGERREPAPSYTALRAASVDVTDTAAASARGSEAELARSRIGDFTLESASAELSRLSGSAQPLLLADASRETPAERSAREQRLGQYNRAFSALSAILATDEGSVERAREAFVQRPNEEIFVLDALASSGGAAAQAALIRVANDATMPSFVRERAVASVIRIKEPSAATLDALLAWLGEASPRATSAVYGLGTASRLLRERGEAGLALRASAALAERLRRSQDDVERVHLLRGIANSADVALLDDVRPLLVDKSESTRAAAVEALRLMNDPRVDAIIAERIAKEQSARVLLDAIDAVKPRAPSATLWGALTQVALHSLDSQARYRAVNILSGWSGARPELRRVLGEVAAHDTNEDVRRIAEAASEKS